MVRSLLCVGSRGQSCGRDVQMMGGQVLRTCGKTREGRGGWWWWGGSGSLVEGDADVGGGDVALVPVGPAHPRPAVSLVLLHHRQDLPLLHGDGPLAGTCRVGRGEGRRGGERGGWREEGGGEAKGGGAEGVE